MQAIPDFDSTVAMMREMGLEVLDAQSHPQSFGSWFVAARAPGKGLRVVWDGRDRVLAVQELSQSGLPDEWADRWIAGDGYRHSTSQLRDGLVELLKT